MKKSNLQRGYRTPDNKTLKTTYKISSKAAPGSYTTVTHTAFGVPFATELRQTKAFSGAEISKSTTGREIVKHYNKPEYQRDMPLHVDSLLPTELKVEGTVDFGETSVPFGVKVKPKVNHPITWFSGV